jgi:hypothetical protein
MQELDETMYWIELLVESKIVSAAILVTSVKTMKRRR